MRKRLRRAAVGIACWFIYLRSRGATRNAQRATILIQIKPARRERLQPAS